MLHRDGIGHQQRRVGSRNIRRLHLQSKLKTVGPGKEAWKIMKILGRLFAQERRSNAP